MPEISRYKTYYYSGGQAQIYLEDVFLDEVHTLQFSTLTNKSPIYGYASERFDTVAKGNIIVQGSFTVNFVSVGYLNIISQAIIDERNRAGVRQIGDFLGKTPSLDHAGGAAFEFNPLINREGFVTTKDASPFQLQQAINQIRGLGNKEFKEYAYALERQRGLGNKIAEEFYEMPPFEIYAVFGDYNDPNANHTVRRIKDVYLVGQSQVISSNGDPVQEHYNFIARDIG